MFVALQEMRAVIISGKVVINGTNQPLDAASVFLNNTTFGTLTNLQGEFELSIPEGHYMLIVTYIGYNTYNHDIDVSSTSENSFFINLIPKTYSISEIVISASAEDWEINFRHFKSVFLGSTPNSDDCKILNPHSVRLYRDKQGSLKAYSDTFILVENKALGYLIKFKLEFFISNFNESSFYGYVLFEDNSLQSPKKKKIQEKREEAYEGSVMHLLRSLYQNNYESEGFTFLKVLEQEIDTTINHPRTIMNNSLLLKNKRGTQLIQTEDTIKMNEFIDTIKNIKVLYYADPFEVSYKKKPQLAYYNYDHLYAGINGRRKRQTSILFMKSHVGLFDKYGVYLKWYDLMLAGYMSWKRMADMLPDNYERTPVEVNN
jgi:hypothetical protein